MEWTINIDRESGYAEVVTSGIADEGGSLEMARAIPGTLLKNKIKKIIIDHRNISSVTGNIPNVFSRPKELKVMGAVPEIRVAEVVKPEHEKFFKFLEIVFVNRGFSFSIFYDKETAMNWLEKA